MEILRHDIDREYCAELLAERRDWLPDSWETIGRSPDNLSGFASDHLQIVRFASVVDPDSDEIPRYVSVAAQALSALFAAGRAGGKPVNCKLGDREAIVYTTGVDESLLHAGRWIRCFLLALISRDTEVLDTLCETSAVQLLESSTQNAEYQYRFMEALRGFWTEDTDTANNLLAALEATDPERPDIIDEAWTLHIDVPLLEVFLYAVSGDSRFSDSLTEAVQLHKEYWSSSEDRMDHPDGYISFKLTAMAAMAVERDIPFVVQSDYLPDVLVRGTS